MKMIRYIAILIIVLLIGSWFVFHSLTIFIEPGQAGVRTIEYAMGSKKGVEEKDFGPGYHLDLGPMHSWQRFDTTIQTLEMTRDPSRGSVKSRDDVQIQSADGYTVSVDVTVKYRIKDGLAHRVYQDTGTGIKYKTIVRNEAQSACMALFGQMRTEDLYDPDQRRNRSEEVQQKLVASLEDNFVEVIDVLIRDVQFDPEYEKKIQLKKLADQEVELNKSMARAEEMRGITQVVEAETVKLVDIIKKEKEAKLMTMQAQTDLQVAQITAEYERYATEKRADADLIAAQKEAQGQLLIKQAEAKGETLRNQAMQGVGGSTIVALEAARNLNLKNATVSTMQVDLLDLDGMATRLGVPE